MITFKPATEAQYEEFLDLMLDHMADYLNSLMTLMEMTIEEFTHLLKTVGQVYSINLDNEVAGFYWTEERGRELHLHGLILKENCQGQGIGTQTLNVVAEKHKDTKDFIELGVHKSNQRAIELYKTLGYQIHTTRDDVGFYIMQKTLSGAQP